MQRHDGVEAINISDDGCSTEECCNNHGGSSSNSCCTEDSKGGNNLGQSTREALFSARSKIMRMTPTSAHKESKEEAGKDARVHGLNSKFV